jgi:hypothetical protein
MTHAERLARIETILERIDKKLDTPGSALGGPALV